MEIYSLAGLSLNEKREYLGFEKINEKYTDQPMIPEVGTSFVIPAMYDISDNISDVSVLSDRHRQLLAAQRVGAIRLSAPFGSPTLCQEEEELIRAVNGLMTIPL